MKIKRKIFAVVMAMALVFSLLPATAVNAIEPISVTIDGVAVQFAAQGPVVIGGRTLVPVRGVFELLGFAVDWDGAIQQATLTSDSHVVVLTIGSATFTTNGVSHTLDAPAQVIGGSTMLPLRAVIESVGHSVDWDAATQTVLVVTAAPPPVVDPEPPTDYEDPEEPEYPEYPEEENDEEYTPTPAQNDSIVGTWELVELPPLLYDELEFFLGMMDTFNSDGTGVSVLGDEMYDFVWTIHDNVLIIEWWPAPFDISILYFEVTDMYMRQYDPEDPEHVWIFRRISQ